MFSAGKNVHEYSFPKLDHVHIQALWARVHCLVWTSELLHRESHHLAWIGMSSLTRHTILPCPSTAIQSDWQSQIWPRLKWCKEPVTGVIFVRFRLQMAPQARAIKHAFLSRTRQHRREVEIRNITLCICPGHNLTVRRFSAPMPLINQQTMGSNCARTLDVTHDIERRPTTTEIRVAYDNSTWHAMNTTYIISTKETSLLGNYWNHRHKKTFVLWLPQTWECITC